MAKKKFKLTTSTAAIIAIVVIVFVIFFATSGQTAQLIAAGRTAAPYSSQTGFIQQQKQPTGILGPLPACGYVLGSNRYVICPKGYYCDVEPGSVFRQGLCRGTPDLIVNSIYFDPANPKAGDNITYGYVAKNIGLGQAGQKEGANSGVKFIHVWYSWNGTGYEQLTCGSGWHRQLLAGENLSIPLGTNTTDVGSTAGTYLLKVCEDINEGCTYDASKGSIKELDDSEKSNCKNATLTFI